MEEAKDTYRTIAEPSNEVLFKEKNSKFFGYAFPIQKEEEVKLHLEQLKKQHFSARHWCYAYQMGTDKISYRANDDGEPNNSAGMPIYGQIQSFDVTNVLIVVVRYFGGVKLGVGGLISAYKTAAQMALENAIIIEKTIDVQFQLFFEYKNMNKVMRIIKEKNLEIIHQELTENCILTISTRKKNAEKVFDIFSNLFEVEIKTIA
ncbi:IMPACT family protein [Flavobacterium filum]|uniref:IMPACT family protein n=1 Tax=Flavobacterium filum TaxID=370974 RepID=UPI00041A30A8|nr:YigZ family protein [Flavobacterium filum]